ncbi:hypothetical protein HA051_08115 [Chromobacterium vaccinii]|nr:hypothetical protein [Chromobacterium vaccinii]
MLEKAMRGEPFTFRDIAFSQVVWIGGVPYATRRAVGEWLEYAEPQKAIGRIVERNPHIEAHSLLLKVVAADQKNYETLVYHPFGILLMVMASGQCKTKLARDVIELACYFAQREIQADDESAFKCLSGAGR